MKSETLRRLALLVALALTSACGGEAPSRRLIVAVLPTAGNPYWQTMQRGIEAGARTYGDTISLTVHIGDEDDGAEKQVEILQSLQAVDGIDVLILGPAASQEVVPALVPILSQGTQLVVVDSRLDSGVLAQERVRVAAFIGSENVVGGRMAAETIQRQVGSDSVHILLLEGNPVHKSALDRSEGFRSGAPPRWWIDRQRADWSREKAISVTEGVLASGIPDAIFAASDEMAMGAVQALKARAVPQRLWPPIVGFDATEEGMRAIQARELCASIKQKPDEMGRLAVQIAMQLLRGDTISLRREVLIPTEVFPDVSVSCR